MIAYSKLPVYQQKEKILEGLKKSQIIVVESPTGSGKTTQIPVILHEAGYSKNGIIGVTQPRRIATLSVSDFIAKQLDTPLGHNVGYKMRFEDKTTSDTVIKIMTDGILLQELKSDPYLHKYSVIMVDEAHERSLTIDFILGLLKNLLKDRKELKVIISSATINSSVFSNYFDNAPVISIDTPIYPIKLIYNPIPIDSQPDILYQTITSIISNYITEKSDSSLAKQNGDILVFLQGEKNIKDCTNHLYQSNINSKLFILQLYGRLSKEEQEKVFIPTPQGKTKVVIATNIAETSVTINGISLVIDSGLAKINYYSPSTFTSSLVEKKISKASAEQRKGRAGRTAPGICYRLYSQEDFLSREDFTPEEIYRTDLSEVLLQMSDLGIRDFEGFNYISPPTADGIASANETLLLLNAIDNDRFLTPIGKKMVYFPLMPRHSRMIVEAILHYPNAIEEITIAASFLSSNSPFLLPQGEELEARYAHHTFGDRYGDFISYLKLYRAYTKCQTAKEKERFCNTYYLDQKTMDEILNIKDQLAQMISQQGIPISNGAPIADYLICIATGLIQFVCVNYRENSYKSMKAEKIAIHPGSVMFKERPQYIVAGEIVKTSKIFARSVSLLKREWIEIIKPGLLKELSSVTSKKLLTGVTKKEHNQEKAKDKNSHQSKNSMILNLNGHEIQLRSSKGKKKQALFYWPMAYQIAKEIPYLELLPYAKLRGTLLFEGLELFSNHKVPNILLGALFIDPSKDLIKADLSKNYNDKNSFHHLIEEFPKLLKLVKIKKRELAIISLCCNNKDSFWLSPCPSFLSAIDNTLSSLDHLVELLHNQLSEKEKELINRVYNKINDINKIRYSNSD